MQISEESWRVIVDEAWPLLEAHREELATNKGLMVLSPNRDAYEDIEQHGSLLCLVARAASGQITGYSVCMLGRHLHYDMVYAHNDVLYVDPAHRKGRLGLRLINETEARAKARGAQFIIWHAKPDTALAALMPRLGYRLQDLILSREL